MADDFQRQVIEQRKAEALEQIAATLGSIDEALRVLTTVVKNRD